MSIEFTDDEIETIKDILSEWGSDCPGTEYGKVLELQYKLGMVVRPTEEELAAEEKRRKEFAESDFGKQMAAIFSDANSHLSKMAEQIVKDSELVKLDIAYGSKNLIGSKLRIVMPINKIGITNE